MKPATKIQLMVASVILAFNGVAKADAINGDIAIGAFGSGSFSNGTLTLSALNIAEGPGTGDLSSVDAASYITADSSTLTGLSSSATTESINDFFELSSPGLLNSTGTTPANRFDFDLTSITEVDHVNGIFTGTGILSDSTSQLANALATFTLAFDGPGTTNYSLSLSTAPEPSTWAMLFGGLGLLAFLNTRLRRTEV